MVNRSEVVVNSGFGHPVHNLLLSHGEASRNLVVLFPGWDNSTDIPTLHYARKAALLSGCDVLSLDYGYRIGLWQFGQCRNNETGKRRLCRSN